MISVLNTMCGVQSNIYLCSVIWRVTLLRQNLMSSCWTCVLEFDLDMTVPLFGHDGMWSVAFDGHIYVCYGAFVGYVYMQVMCIWAYHEQCCCQNFKKSIKFWSCLKVIKIWFQFAWENSFWTSKIVLLFKIGVKSQNSDNSRGKLAFSKQV